MNGARHVVAHRAIRRPVNIILVRVNDVLKRPQFTGPLTRRKLKGGMGGNDRAPIVLSIDRYFFKTRFEFSANAQPVSSCFISADKRRYGLLAWNPFWPVASISGIRPPVSEVLSCCPRQAVVSPDCGAGYTTVFRCEMGQLVLRPTTGHSPRVYPIPSKTLPSSDNFRDPRD